MSRVASGHLDHLTASLHDASSMGFAHWMAMAAFLVGCAAEAGPPAGDAAWRKALLDERARTDAEFKGSPVSPLSAVDRRALQSGQSIHADVEPGALRLTEAAGAATALSFTADAGGWTWRAARSGANVVATRRAGGSLAPGPIESPSVFDLGRFSLAVQPAADSLVVMVHDAEREELRAFRALNYYAPDPRYLVTARIERWSEPQEITLPTTIRLQKSYRRRARLHFSIGDQAYALTAFVPVGASPRALFIPFRDATSGRSTYGGGRYLDLQEPEGDSISIDFNRAYNPMCNYSSAFNCPIPPPENRLRVAIEAGQKTHDH